MEANNVNAGNKEYRKFKYITALYKIYSPLFTKIRSILAAKTTEMEQNVLFAPERITVQDYCSIGTIGTADAYAPISVSAVTSHIHSILSSELINPSGGGQEISGVNIRIMDVVNANDDTIINFEVSWSWT